MMKLRVISLAILSIIILARVPTGFAQAGDELAGTSWQLISYGSPGAEISVIEGSTLTLSFDEELHASGSAGCNSFGSNYSLEDGTLSFSMVVSTLMACMEEGLMQQEQAYLQALQSVNGYELSEDQLILSDGDGQQLVFAPLGSLIGTEWVLVAFAAEGEEKPILEGSHISLNFGYDSNISGSGGCNSYGGNYILTDNIVSFSQIYFTERACLEDGLMAQESAWFAALSAATLYELKADQLIIHYGEGDEQLIFMRAPSLAGTQWQLLSFGTETRVLGDQDLTLEFAEDERVLGYGGCNMFSGGYSVMGADLSFTPLASTRRACLSDALNAQEADYLSALQAVTSFEIAADQLILNYGEGQLLIFSAMTSMDEA